jgi:hypothetical protein
MVQTEFDPVQVFEAEAAQRAEAFESDVEKSTRALHSYTAKVRAYEDLDDAGKEAAITKVRDMLSVEIAIKLENLDGTRFGNYDEARQRGHEILSAKATELQLETLDA